MRICKLSELEALILYSSILGYVYSVVSCENRVVLEWNLNLPCGIMKGRVCKVCVG